MYVKWQLRSRKRGGGYLLLTAVLVESRRVDGKPRQREVAYLAGIRERFIGEREDEHDKFWTKVDARLDALGLDTVTRAKIEVIVAKRVPRVTAENRAEFAAAMAHLRGITDAAA